VALGGLTAARGEVGTPLGIIERPELPELELELARGDLIAFYTDGVSEAAAPKRILDEHDLAALVAERAAAGPRAVVEHLEATAVAIAAGDPRDDLACLAVQVLPPVLFSRQFPATRHAARDVAAVLAPLNEQLGARTAQDLRLLATELVANAVRHTGIVAGTVEVQVRLDGGRVHLSVLDEGPGFEPPERPVVAPQGPGGWGLYLVDRCAVRWGSERGERHRVWLELECEHAA
jgi:anti-sigma regulatory factor (Ser/Thr protein kinase)